MALCQAVGFNNTSFYKKQQNCDKAQNSFFESFRSKNALISMKYSRLFMAKITPDVNTYL